MSGKMILSVLVKTCTREVGPEHRLSCRSIVAVPDGYKIIISILRRTSIELDNDNKITNNIYLHLYITVTHYSKNHKAHVSFNHRHLPPPLAHPESSNDFCPVTHDAVHFDLKPQLMFPKYLNIYKKEKLHFACIYYDGKKRQNYGLWLNVYLRSSVAATMAPTTQCRGTSGRLLRDDG